MPKQKQILPVWETRREFQDSIFAPRSFEDPSLRFGRPLITHVTSAGEPNMHRTGSVVSASSFAVSGVHVILIPHGDPKQDAATHSRLDSEFESKL
jgi:hypothetical protein